MLTWERLHISYFSFAEIEWLILQSLGNMVIGHFYVCIMGPVRRFGTWILVIKGTSTGLFRSDMFLANTKF